MKQSAIATLLLVLLSACSDESPVAQASFGTPEFPLSAEGIELPNEHTTDQGDPTAHGQLPPSVLFEIAQRHMNEGKYDAALGHLDLAVAQLPNDPALLATRATVHSALGHAAKALADIERACALAPGDPALLTNRGQILRGFGRDDDALHDFDEALDVESTYYPALFNRGVLKFNQGENAAALANFTAAIAAQPETGGGYYNRAFVYEAMGDLESAKSDMHAFLERTKDSDLADLAKSHLATWESPK